jgi:hypothetical protein
MLSIHPLFLLRILTEVIVFMALWEVFMWSRLFAMLHELFKDEDHGPNT